MSLNSSKATPHTSHPLCLTCIVEKQKLCFDRLHYHLEGFTDCPAVRLVASVTAHNSPQNPNLKEKWAKIAGSWNSLYNRHTLNWYQASIKLQVKHQTSRPLNDYWSATTSSNFVLPYPHFSITLPDGYQWCRTDYYASLCLGNHYLFIQVRGLPIKSVLGRVFLVGKESVWRNKCPAAMREPRNIFYHHE